MGLWSAADDLLRGGRRAIGGFADSITGKEVRQAQDWLDARKLQADAIKNTPVTPMNPNDAWAQAFPKDGPPTKDWELELANNIAKRNAEYDYDLAVINANEDVTQAAKDLNSAKINRNFGRGILGTTGVTVGGVGLGIAAENGAFNNVNFGSGSPTLIPTATPQITDRDLDYVAPTSKAPAYVPDASKYDLKPTYIPSETLPDIPEAPPPDMLGATSTPGEYVIQKGDTLWDLTGGDQEKIKELAALNNIKNVDLILAGATLKTPSMDYLNRQLGE